MAMRIAGAQHAPGDVDLVLVQVDVEVGRAGDRGPAHAARDERRVRGLAALAT